MGALVGSATVRFNSSVLLIDLRPAAIKRITNPQPYHQGLWEDVMAWIEQTGTRSWRVRYLRHPCRYGTVSGFTSRTTARAYTHDLESTNAAAPGTTPPKPAPTFTRGAEKWIDSIDDELST